MAKARPYLKLELFVFALFAAVFVSVLSYSSVSAGVSRGAINGAETTAVNKCTTGPNTIYGAVWINSVPGSDGSGARWNEDVTIAYDATFVDATMWTTAYNCPSKGTISNNAVIENLSSAGGGTVPISFPYGTSIYRGDSTAGQFTDPPGQITVRLDLSGKNSNDYTVTYSGNFRDNRGAGASNLYTSTIHVTRSPAPPPPPPPPDPDPPPVSNSCSITPTLVASNATPSIGQQFTLSWAMAGARSGTARVLFVRFRAAGSTNDKTSTSNFFSGSLNPIPGSKSGNETKAGRWTYIIAITEDSTGTDCYAFARVYVQSGSGPGPIVDTKPTVSITTDCSAKNAKITSTDTDATGAFTTDYQINGGPFQSYNQTSGTTFVVNMSSYDQTLQHVVYAKTDGVVKTGATAAGTGSYSITYGPCATAATPFTVTPTGSVVITDPENPVQATFIRGANSDTKVNGITITRRYYKMPGNSPILSATSESQNLNTSYTSASDIRAITAAIGDSICMDVTVDPGSGTVDLNGVVQTAGAPTTQTFCDTALAKPIFRVYGGDVAAGYTSCGGGNWPSAPKNSKIIGYNKGDGQGSGVQLAAFATNIIQQFSSATGRTANPIPPKGLSFSNTTGDPTYGGAYGAGDCPYDYWGSSTRPSTNKPIIIATSGTYAKYSPTSIGALSINTKITYYVEGNVTITGNIAYGPYTDVNSVPNFTLIVHGGNIYIDKSVMQLDGVYIAQPNGSSGGQIYTCTNGSTTYSLGADIYAACNTKLTVNGAFIAKRVRLLRTIGSLKDSNNNQLSDNPNIAESFIYGPEFWLAAPNTGNNTGTPKFDSYTALPPVL